jgi:hypothetical protein
MNKLDASLDKMSEKQLLILMLKSISLLNMRVSRIEKDIFKNEAFPRHITHSDKAYVEMLEELASMTWLLSTAEYEMQIDDIMERLRKN